MKRLTHKNIDMLNGPLAGKILLFAIPLALSSVLQQLLSSADASVAGRFISNQSLAGIGAVMPITSTFVNLFVGLAIGANVVIAMRIGSGNMARVKETIHTAMALALASGLVLMVAGLAVSSWVLNVVNMPADSLGDALTYLRLYFCALPFLALYNFGSAILRAHGDAQHPLYSLAIAVVLNLILNLIFVRVFGWGTAGIGVATIIACAANAAIIVFFLMHEEEPYALNLREIRFQKSPLRTMLLIGIPAGIQGAVFPLSNTVVQSAINGFGSAAIAGSAATLNFECYTYFFVNAFAQTTVTFVGQNFAAKKIDRCKAIMRWCLLFGFASALFLGVTFTTLGELVLSIFTVDATALHFGMIRMWFIELPDCLTSLYEVPAGAMRGMGWSVLPAVVTIIGSCVLRIGFVLWIFPYMNSFSSLMALYPVTWIFMTIVMMSAYFIVSRRAFRAIETTKKETPTATAA